MSKIKLNNLLIVGVDETGALNNAINLDGYDKDAYQGNLRLGNGKDLLPLNDIIKLKDNYDLSSAVRIDVDGHGHNVDGIHHIDLSGSYSIPTHMLFSAINEAFGNKPVHIHLWSCYGGNAAKDVDKLAPGSCVIAHVSENNMLTGQEFLEKSIEAEKIFGRNAPLDHLDYEEVLSNLNIGFVNDCVIGINTSDGIDHSKEIIKFSPSLKSMAEGKLDEALHNFRIEVFKHLVKLPENIKGVYVPKIVLDNPLNQEDLDLCTLEAYKAKVSNVDNELLNILNNDSSDRILESFPKATLISLSFYRLGQGHHKVEDTCKLFEALSNHNRMLDRDYISISSEDHTSIMHQLVNYHSTDNTRKLPTFELSRLVGSLLKNYSPTNISKIFNLTNNDNITPLEFALSFSASKPLAFVLLQNILGYGVKLSSLINPSTGKNILHFLDKGNWFVGDDNQKPITDLIVNYIKRTDTNEIRDLLLHQDKEGNSTYLAGFINDKSYNVLDALFEGLSNKADEISKVLKQDPNSNDLDHAPLTTLDQLHISYLTELDSTEVELMG